MAEHQKHRRRDPKTEFSGTVNLPRTDFPMRGELPQREPEILHRWELIDLYQAVQQRTAGRPHFILHDGPPFSNGNIHLGHALNKILKDIVVKFRSMQGYDAPFVPGWDTHGLPTEIAAIRTFSIDRYAIKPLDLRRRCAETARRYVELQREQFIRLGIRGDWDRPYLTMQPRYAATVVETFGQLVDAGLIYRGLKPVYWCTACETALAEAEIDYREHEANAIYVAFPVAELAAPVFPGQARARMAAVIWTTTPWTLPANVAIAARPDARYVLVTDRQDEEHFSYIVASERVDGFAQAAQMREPTVLAEVSGRALEGAVFRHPFLERQVPLVLADYVTLETGTGLVHLAPGHGQDDFITGLSYRLPVIQPVGPSGVYGPEAGPFAGKVIYDAEARIIALLDRTGTLLAHGTVLQQYPHCWRCRGPVIMRATPQWFFAVQRLQEAALAAVPTVEWRPRWGEERMTDLVTGRPDWCISRQRVWGIPIPVLYCTSCEEPLLSRALIATARDLVRAYGTDEWYRRSVAELLPDGAACAHCGRTEFRKETEIFDVWFDSSCSHLAVLQGREELAWPADLFLEGHDQYRGWFQVSLLTSLGVEDRAPYRTVMAHGFILDQTGQKQSKSLGNIIDPQRIVRKYGADILRLWTVSADVRADLVMSEEAFTQVVESYRRLRNILRFLLGNLYDFTPEMASPLEELPELDRWVLLQLNRLIRRITEAYDRYEFHLIYHAVQEFCGGTLSACYLDVAKDWLYTALPDAPARRATQTVFAQLAQTLAQLLAPILSFTAEEVWQYLPGTERPPSVQLTDWPVPRAEWEDAELDARWSRLLQVRDDVRAALAAARAQGVISQPSAAKVTLYSAGEIESLLESVNTLPKLLIVSAVETSPWEARPLTAFVGRVPELAITVTPAPGVQCPRCRLWRATRDAAGNVTTVCAECAAILAARQAA